jgi:DNA ligase 1
MQTMRTMQSSHSFDLLARRRLLLGTLMAPMAYAATAWHPATAKALAKTASLPWQPLLAQDAPADIDPAGYLVSEKLDGVRALWDGQVLRFRSGGLIHAPADFLAALPRQPLDGELWAGRGQFEALVGTVRRLQPGAAAWGSVRFMAFELPGSAPLPSAATFAQRSLQLQALQREQGNTRWAAAPQISLPSRQVLQAQLNKVVQGGGEGLMLHRADAPVLGGRNAALLKLKPVADAEAVVLAHLPGQGKHAGRLGALRVRSSSGHVFNLGTGLSDDQRAAPPAVGSTVTYNYRGLTADGVPRFASFLRERVL